MPKDSRHSPSAKGTDSKSSLALIIDYLVRYVADAAAIVAAAYVLVKSFVDPYELKDLPLLATIIIGLLGVLVVTGHWERSRKLDKIERVSDEVARAVRGMQNSPRAEDYFLPPEYKVSLAEIEHARDFRVVGAVLNRAVRDNLSTFTKLAGSGAKLRFILMNPKSDHLLDVVQSRGSGVSKKWWQDRIDQTVGQIEEIPRISRTPGAVMIGFLPYSPSFGMWLIDADTLEGRVIVELYPHQTVDAGPAFRLTAIDDPDWFRFFKEQFDLMWNACNELGEVRKL